MYNGLGARKKIVVLEHFIEENINFSREVKQMEDGVIIPDEVLTE